MFALTVSGLGELAGQEIAGLSGAWVEDSGFDGRSDVVLFSRDDAKVAGRLRLAEDVFVEVGRTLRASGDDPRWISGRLWRPQRVREALSVWEREVHPLRARASFRVIARVLQERSFLRTNLRRSLTTVIQHDQPLWSIADPGQLEVWIIEYRPGHFVTGLRVSDASMRQHDGRLDERPGALRPAVAAAMVRLAGPAGLPLLDPCCGSGTILREAAAERWTAQGVDVDPEAVNVARRNARGADVQVGDARSLPLDDDSLGACVSNLPFGHQHQVTGDMNRWLKTVLGEMARVTRVGGRVVVLIPDIPRSLIPRQLKLAQRHPIRVLGMQATIWAFDRVADNGSLSLGNGRAGGTGGARVTSSPPPRPEAIVADGPSTPIGVWSTAHGCGFSAGTWVQAARACAF
jgi:SAM-dependent methyltransferase